MENKTTSQGIFINGKAQVIKMFQLLNDSEKEMLITKIRVKNPSLANELLQESYSFEDLNRLSDDNIRSIFQHIDAQILGLALKESSIGLQKRALSLAERSYAERAYETLILDIKDEKIHIERARKKVIDTIMALNKKNLLRI
ncbi:MAG: FliG C-terminal domain-containing protein [Bacteriovoracaceae bacterium]